MSTNKTQHFGLSQWQSTDPIRVADFNADNQKLDTALAARAYERLLAVTTRTKSNEVSLDVSGIDFTKYLKVELLFDDGGYLPGTGHDTALHKLWLNGVKDRKYVNCSLDGWNTCVLDGATDSALLQWRSVAGRPSGVTLQFGTIIPNGSVTCSVLSLTGSSDYYAVECQIGYATEILWKDLQSIQLSNEAGIPAGSHFALYGVRK